MGDEKELRLLVTSAGGLTGTFLIRHLQRRPIEPYRYELIAADSNGQSIARHMCPAFYHVPRSDDPGYKEAIYRIIDQEKIDIVIPASSYDIPFYSANRDQLAAKGVQCLISDYQTNELLNHKRTMYELMHRIGVPVPQVYASKKHIIYPAIIKACKSSGSVGVYKLENDLDYRYWTAKLQDYVITAYVRGREFTVDCLFDASGKQVLVSTRERMQVRGGAVVVTRGVATPEAVQRIVRKLEAELTLIGPVNFQYIQDERGEVYLTDFNTRFASGGLPLTIAAGYDIPNLMIRLMLGQSVSAAPLPAKQGLTMYRYYDELFAQEV